MSYIRPTNSDIIRYTLMGDLGTLEILEPKGWNEDEKTFKRSTDVHGVFASFSNNLEFYKGDEYYGSVNTLDNISDNSEYYNGSDKVNVIDGNITFPTNSNTYSNYIGKSGGYSFLKDTYDLYGINASVKLLKEEKIGAEWLNVYSGYLNFAEYVRDENYIKIKFDESGLYEKIKARKSEKFEIDRTTTMDGDEIEELEKKTVNLKGRKINIIDSWKKKTDVVKIAGDQAYYEARAIPMQMKTEISGNSQTIYDYDVDEITTSYRSGNIGNMFYAVADVETTFRDIDINLDMNVKSSKDIYKIRLDLVIYENSENCDFKEYTTILEKTDISKTQHVENWQALVPELTLNAGESCALVFHFTYVGGGFGIEFFMEKVDFVLKREEFYESSDAEFYLPFEAMERTLHIITGQENALKSKLLGRTDLGYDEDGFASLMGITDGYSIRKFDDKHLTTTFKDMNESFNVVAQAGYGIENINGNEYVRYEDIRHFYQDIPTIKIGQPSGITRTVSQDYFYSGIELGYKKPTGDDLYDEAMGLDEYNTINTYTTNISRVENVFSKVSPYRADDYGKEFARRKRQPDFTSEGEDTTYDSSIWFLDLKKGSGTKYEERKWGDDFEYNTNGNDKFSIFATGIYSAETASNLRFSPLNLLLRWGFWIRGGLEKYLETFIRYSSSDGNSELKTQLSTDDYPNSKLYAESDNVLVGDLDRGIFVPEEIEFDYDVDSDLMRNINSTSINKEGETIMNYYGLVEFTNEDGLLEYGWLLELKPNTGKWTILKANRITVNKAISSSNYVSNVAPSLSGDNINVKI